MDAAAFEHQLRNDGYDEILTKDLEAGSSLDWHEHPWDVHVLVLAGSFEITTDEGAATYREGDSFILSAGVRHQEGPGPDGARLLIGRRR